MKLLTVIFFCLVCCLPAKAKANPLDPYSIQTVQMTLKFRSGHLEIIYGSLQRVIFQLGDDVSIALLKILDDRQLRDPATLSHYLPIIHDAFSHPELISNDVDRTPSVTLFLLADLQRSVKDSAARAQIRETIEYVKKQAAEQLPARSPHP